MNHDKLLELIQGLDIDGKDLRLIRNVHYGQKAAIRIKGELGEWVCIQKGVRQRCILSPDLLNLYSEEALKTIRMCDGVDLEGTNYNNLQYADDTALIENSEEKLQRLLKVVAKESERLGLRINCDKTYVLVASKKAKDHFIRANRSFQVLRQLDNSKWEIRYGY